MLHSKHPAHGLTFFASLAKAVASCKTHSHLQLPMPFCTALHLPLFA